MDLNAYKLKVRPDQSLIKQQKTRVLTRPCVDKSNVLLLWNEQSATSLQCHAGIIFFCPPGILHAVFLHSLMWQMRRFPPVCSVFPGGSLESSLWPACSTSKYHSNVEEQHDPVMRDPGPVIFVPLHYTELLIVSGGIFIPCPWFLWTHATSPALNNEASG